MTDLKISEIVAMCDELQEKYKGKWTPLSPEEWSKAFVKKHNKNMGRDFMVEHGNYLKK